MELPLLENYRSNFLKKGLQIPLIPVPYHKSGLLVDLPPAPAGKTGWPWTEQFDATNYNANKSWPKLTIVTPSFNQGNFLEETIRSVLLQNYPNFEFIVIDGGSTDSSKQILEKYSPWISYWQSGKDNGQSQAINMGFSLASGDYYAWINSDDYYLKDTFFTVINSFTKHQTDFVYGYAFNYTDGSGKFDLIKVPPLLDYFIKIPTLVQPSCFWRSAIHQPVWEEMHCALDFELWLRLVRGNKRKRIRKPLSVAHVHDQAKTSDPDMKVKWHEDHVKMWAGDAHGSVPEWKRIVLLNRIRMKIYQIFNWL